MADSRDSRPTTRPTSWAARILAPLALLIVAIAVIVVVVSSTGGEETTDSPATQAEAAGAPNPDKEGPETPREYEVQEGDSLTSIADEFGVSVKRLQRLNPDVDPNALNAGTPITLR